MHLTCSWTTWRPLCTVRNYATIYADINAEFAQDAPAIIREGKQLSTVSFLSSQTFFFPFFQYTNLRSRQTTLFPSFRSSNTTSRQLHLKYTHMTSIGTGYDLANSIFSPDGRNFQVEYASKAVENAGTSIGLCCTDGVVLATEKLKNSKLLVPGKNKRIQSIDRHVGVVYSGLIPDGRHFVNRGRDEA